jgi:hypothetical protein
MKYSMLQLAVVPEVWRRLMDLMSHLYSKCDIILGKLQELDEVLLMCKLFDA